MMSTDKKISLALLTAMVVGGMIGAGIFSLPRTFAIAAGPFGALIAWLIAGTGMYTLARVFQTLAERKPDMDAGVYAYAKAGFGNYPGFLSALGYWLGSCIGNVSYWVLIKSTLGAFFPVFGSGNTLVAIVVASIGIWLFHFTILRGIQQATFINSVVTVAKIIPILAFILILIGFFRLDVFQANFWGGNAASDVFEQEYKAYPHQLLAEPAMASLFDQVRATMLTTVFVFLGIEGASVYSRFARKRTDVGRATIIGFVFVTSLMVLVTILPFAVLDRQVIAGMQQPSMAGVLEAVVGRWGAVFVSAGLIVSVLGAYLAWSLICAEVLFSAAKTQDMPAIFASENANKVPANALWLSNIIVQLLVISTYFSYDAFALMLNLTSSMSLIPFLMVAAYGFMLSRRGETYDRRPRERQRDMVIAGIAIVYTLFLIYAGGLKFVLLSAVLYGPGTILYIWTRREQGQPVFTRSDWIIFGIAIVGAVAGITGLVTGTIRL
jgi:arginine:ornithine antiporter / lysine permease